MKTQNLATDSQLVPVILMTSVLQGLGDAKTLPVLLKVSSLVVSHSQSTLIGVTVGTK